MAPPSVYWAPLGGRGGAFGNASPEGGQVTRFALRFRSPVAVCPRGARGCAGRVAGRCAGLLFALCALGHGARAGDKWVEQEPRWIPSLRFGFDTFGYGTEATVTNFVNPPKNAGTQSETSPLFMLQLGGELVGPVRPCLDGVLHGRPRLSAQAGVQLKPFSSDSVLEIDVPGDAQPEVTSFQNTLANRIAGVSCDLPGSTFTCPLIPQSFLGEG